MMDGRKIHVPTQKPVFENRYDAGRQLAEKLIEFKNQPVIILAIPNGGLPIAVPVALELNAELDVVISRKLPIPLLPEGGFGAVADDGSPIFNQEILQKINLTEYQINYQVNKVRNDIRERSLLYRSGRPLSIVNDKIAIIVDDGLASGYTMMAAVESVRRRHPKQIIAAVPTASATAIKQVEKQSVRVVTVYTGYTPKFYVSDSYRYWNVLTDEEGVRCFKDWHTKYSQLKNGFQRPDEKQLRNV
jgi:predicted phosphoribosyltransferase